MTAYLATRSVKLTNMAAAVGYSDVVFVAFTAQTFVFTTKTKGSVVSARIVRGMGRLIRQMVSLLM